MQKRGQIAVFLIVGVVLILVLGFFLLFVSQKEIISPNDGNDINPTIDITSIDNLIESCLQEELEIALFRIGLQGGYIERLPSTMPSFSTAEAYLPVYYKNSQQSQLFPTIEDMEKSLSQQIVERIRFCFDDFVFYEQQNAEITFYQLDATTTISENGVTTELIIPLSIQKNDKSVDRRSYAATAPLHLQQIHASAVAILNGIQQCEEDQIDWYANVIQQCGTTVGIDFSDIDLIEEQMSERIPWADKEVESCKDNIFTATQQFTKTRLYPYISCDSQPHACTTTSLEIDAWALVNLPPAPPICIGPAHKSPENIKRNIRIHGITDPSYTKKLYDDKAFQFFFVTEIAPDHKDECHAGC